MIYHKSMMIWFFFILILSTLNAADYYVDATNGSDTNSGLSPSSAWNTISKVTKMTLLPGDKILFKRGEKWTGTLLIQNSGSANNRIEYNAYGIGAKPVITTRGHLTGWNVAENWTNTRRNIWRISVAANYMRMFFDGNEYKQAKSSTSLTLKDRFYRTDSYIYVYSAGNPANSYHSIEVPYTNLFSPEYTCKIENANYVTIDDIEFQGGYRTISVENSDYLIVQNCKIGAYTNGAGFVAFGGSNYGIIKNNTVDYSVDFAQYYMNSQSTGIQLANGASFWKIHNNYIRDWILAGYFVIGWIAPCTDNEFFNNEVTSPNQSYGRAFSIYDNISVNPDYIASNNKVYNNYFHHYNVKSQLASNNCEISYNIFANVTDNFNLFPPDHAYGNAGTCLYLYSAASHNKIYNNTFYNSSRSAIYVDGSADNNNFSNNLLIYSGHKDDIHGGFAYVSPFIKNVTAKNNLIWYPGKDSLNYMIMTLRNTGTKSAHFYYNMRTIHGFNLEDGHSGNIISGNFQFTGSLTSLFTNANNDDFSLSPGSPAIDTGVNESWMRTTDSKGNPIVGNRDIGAIEFMGNSKSDEPIITTFAPVNAILGQIYYYDVNATGYLNPTYTLTTKPEDMTINSSSGLIQWTPSATGSYNVTVEVSNGIDPKTTQSFTILVRTATVCPPGMISFWQLDETTDGVFSDRVGANTAFGGTSSPVPTSGIVNNAQQFNGINTQINVRSSNSFDFSELQSFSLEVWVKTVSPGKDNKAFFGRYGENSAAWGLGYGDNNEAILFIRDSHNKFFQVNGTDSINSGKWHHIVGVRDAIENKLKIYVDGILQNSSSTDFSGDFASKELLSIGYYENTYFKGDLDEIAIYNTALSSNEIQQHYNNGLAGLSYCNQSGILKKTGSLNPPIEKFKVYAEDKKVSIQWQTSLDVFQGFELERSHAYSSVTSGNILNKDRKLIWEKINSIIPSGGYKIFEYLDETIAVSGNYSYRIKIIDREGGYSYSEILNIAILPTEFKLYQNFPNPFNPTTTIRFSIPKLQRVSLKIFNKLGEEVEELTNQDYEPGSYEIPFNAGNLASGVYFYRIESEKYSDVKKFILLK